MWLHAQLFLSRSARVNYTQLQSMTRSCNREEEDSSCFISCEY